MGERELRDSNAATHIVRDALRKHYNLEISYSREYITMDAPNRKQPAARSMQSETTNAARNWMEMFLRTNLHVELLQSLNFCFLQPFHFRGISFYLSLFLHNPHECYSNPHDELSFLSLSHDWKTTIKMSERAKEKRRQRMGGRKRGKCENHLSRYQCYHNSPRDSETVRSRTAYGIRNVFIHIKNTFAPGGLKASLVANRQQSEWQRHEYFFFSRFEYFNEFIFCWQRVYSLKFMAFE